MYHRTLYFQEAVENIKFSLQSVKKQLKGADDLRRLCRWHYLVLWALGQLLEISVDHWWGQIDRKWEEWPRKACIPDSFQFFGVFYAFKGLPFVELVAWSCFYTSMSKPGEKYYPSPSKYSVLTRTHFFSLSIHSESAFQKVSFGILFRHWKNALPKAWWLSKRRPLM